MKWLKWVWKSRGAKRRVFLSSFGGSGLFFPTSSLGAPARDLWRPTSSLHSSYATVSNAVTSEVSKLHWKKTFKKTQLLTISLLSNMNLRNFWIHIIPLCTVIWTTSIYDNAFLHDGLVRWQWLGAPWQFIIPTTLGALSNATPGLLYGGWSRSGPAQTAPSHPERYHSLCLA